MASEILVGEYKSAFKGKGLNFDSIREYQIGDDLRSIDWKVTARTSEPHVRQYHEERQLSIVLMLDLSASNDFGTHKKSKREIAVELCAVLAAIAVKNKDKVGLLIFTDDVELYVPPKEGKSHVFSLIRDLMTFKPKSKGTNIKNVLSNALNMIPRSSIVFMISDFVANKEQGLLEKLLPIGGDKSKKSLQIDFEREMKVMRKVQDVVAMSIRDPREFTLPNIGFVELLNPETGEKELLNLNRGSTRKRFKGVQTRYFAELKEKFKYMGVDLLDIRTDKPYVSQLLNLFLTRERRS